MADIETEEGKHPTMDSSILKEMSQDYSGYLEMDSSNERQVFYDGIDGILTKLDEFGAMVDAIRGDTTLCVNENVPKIQNKCEEMKNIFHKVDQLEKFVNVVKVNVNTMEELVNKAENEMGSLSGIKNILSSLLGSKKSAVPGDPSKQYVAPDIFVTEEYLTPTITPAERNINETVQDSKQPETDNETVSKDETAREDS